MHAARPTTTLVSCMRNEGANLIEWIAYHQVLGFNRIVVVTNDCTDGSDLLLDRLEKLGEIIHLSHRPAPGTRPQFEGLRLASQQSQVQLSDWVMVLDADEYVCVTAGGGKISDLIALGDPDADVIPLLWRHFGTAGHQSWNGEWILTSRTRTHERPVKRLVGHKSLFRPQKFSSFHPHMPKGPREPVIVRATDGKPFPTRALDDPQGVRFKAGFQNLSLENAYVAHHALKAPDVVLTKRYRGFGGTPIEGRFDIQGDFFKQRDCNDVECLDLLRHWPEVERRISSLLSDGETDRLHTQTQNWLESEIARVIAIEAPETPGIHAGIHQ